MQAQSAIDYANNGSFEDFATGVLSGSDLGWTFNTNANGAISTFEIIEDSQDSDGRALKISIGDFNNGDDWNIEAVNDNLVVTAGITYSISVWLKADLISRTARMYMGLPASGDWARFGQFDAVLDTVWTKYELEYTATQLDEENTMRFEIPLNFADNTGGAIYVDNLKVLGVDPDGPQNPNGSFEDSEVTERADTAEVTGWVFELQDTGEATFAIVDDIVKDGERALRVDITTQGSNDWSIQAINELFRVEEGVEYTFSAWAKASEAGGTASFTVGNPAFMEFGRIGSEQVSLTTEWQEFSFKFEGGTSDTVGRAPIHLSLAGNAGKSIWIDSVRIQKPIEPDTVYQPIARDKPKFLGNVYSPNQAPRFEQYWNQVTPENAGKWGSVEDTRDVMNWSQMDDAASLAQENGFPLKFHVLVWGDQQPLWLKSLSQEEQLKEITEWFEAVAERYPQLEWVEVVNEPLHDPPSDDPNDDDSGGYIEALGGSGTTGWDWIITSFEMAREIFPDSVKLIMNDYSILGNTSNTAAYKSIIELLQDRDLIDGIGVQAHAFSTKNSNEFGLNNSLNSLGETGLPIQITELDIDGNPDGSNAQSDQAQLDEYKRIFPLFWEHEFVEGITLWGWQIGHWRTEQEAFIIHANNEERPALTWLREYVESTELIVSNEESSDSKLSADSFELSQNYPNPFNPSTQIAYSVPYTSDVSIKVYDITGRVVQILIDRQHNVGSYTVNFNASTLSTGIYFYEIRSGTFRKVKKMMLIK
ncbi:MAG: endo-1,4-beta-xylanase [Balneolaceae bacterium]|nr:endo-1,4-beta-xylanase [Balneolaceae bacterium]MBO6545784.1 endo-1,4-beta-xylanase [Balneolaceae bacterium]MBO6647180.1 endo-1,4-beta-xylanase [Balneolaceae bacterium]